MFKKNISSNNKVEKVGSGEDLSFPKGKKFVYNEKLCRVTKAWQEGPDDFRKVTYDNGDEDIMVLRILQEMSLEPSFHWA
jgi:hypothetical protein